MLMRRLTWRWMTLITVESALIIGAVILGAYVRLGREADWRLADASLLLKAVVIASVAQICIYHADLYDCLTLADRRKYIARGMQAVGAMALILAVVYFWFPALIIGRGVFVLSALLGATLVTAWRVAFGWLTRHVGPRERLMLVGTSPAAVSLARELYERRHELGVEIVGFIDPDPGRVGAVVLNPRIIGTIEDIPALVESRSADRVVISLADARGKLPMEVLLDMKLRGINFDHLASVYEEYTGKIAVENLRPSWLIFSSGFQKSRLVRGVKRAMDIAAALIGLALGVPLMLVIALAVRVTSRGGVFYHQERVGQDGRPFTVHKFRSMREDAEAATGAVWAADGDDRVTPVGRFLRRTRLDELPQLWNILRGEMSLVGPRPERPHFVSQLTREIPFYGQRHVVKPGLTGWAQVRYTYSASVEDAMQKIQYDLFYIKNISIALDLFILLATIKTVIRGRGAR